MPIETAFLDSLLAHIQTDSWNIVLPEGREGNPLVMELSQNNETLKFLVHAKRLTHQAREGENPSTHNRPIGEMHMQMIFDGSRRGAGIRNKLRLAPETDTILLGYYGISNDEYVVIAFDTAYHIEYSYSKSLQVKYQTIKNAQNQGVTFQKRTNGEMIVAFHIDNIMEYLLYAKAYHDVSIVAFRQAATNLSVQAQQAAQAEDTILPQLQATERRRIASEITKFVRDAKFTKAIRLVYERCAICGFQYDDILDAAHIIPVADGGDDTYENGMGLCPNCHRMYDKGLLLVDANYNIHINIRYAELYSQQNRADSLSELQQRISKKLWLPHDSKCHPSPVNLQDTFEKRR